ncbi:MAG: hypothetical protein M0Z52_09020 [Actinomycetota bacterium]|nr:hypothetical protein [Actinomycetota bacterium]
MRQTDKKGELMADAEEQKLMEILKPLEEIKRGLLELLKIGACLQAARTKAASGGNRRAAFFIFCGRL